MIWEPVKGFTIITFPGVPSEMKTMWEETANDFIKTKFSDSYSFFSNTLKFTGIGESSVSEKINDLLNLKNPTVAPYANIGEVKLRITARAKNDLEAKNIIKPVKDFTILTFPGVPSEMKTMWEETAYDFIKTKFSDNYSFFSNTLKFAGIGESSVAEKINDLLNPVSYTHLTLPTITEV